MDYTYGRDRSFDSNRNSRIVSLAEGTTAETFTANRDPGTMTARVDTQDGRTTLTINKSGVTFQFSGHEARTIMSTLVKHDITRRGW